MSLILHNSHWIASHWVCPIEYSDYSGLEDTEIEQLRDFMDKLPEVHSLSWSFHKDGDTQEAEFKRDEISGLMADCYQAEVFVDDGYKRLSLRLTHKYISDFDHLDDWRDIGTYKQLAFHLVADRDSYDDSLVNAVIVHVKADKGTTVKDIKRALASRYDQYGCTHEHDCCGCWSSSTSKIRHLGHGIYSFFLSSFQNY